MLASDLVMTVRASRMISSDQVVQLERMVFGAGDPTADQLELIFLIDTYLRRRDQCWAELLSRAAMSALIRPAETHALPHLPAKAA